MAPSFWKPYTSDYVASGACFFPRKVGPGLLFTRRGFLHMQEKECIKGNYTLTVTLCVHSMLRHMYCSLSHAKLSLRRRCVVLISPEYAKIASQRRLLAEHRIPEPWERNQVIGEFGWHQHQRLQEKWAEAPENSRAQIHITLKAKVIRMTV